MRQTRLMNDATTARNLFIAGFFGLPFLWLLNIIQFWSQSKHPQAPQTLKDSVKYSILCFAMVVVSLIAWNIVFQLEWRKWGVTGQKFLVNERLVVWVFQMSYKTNFSCALKKKEIKIYILHDWNCKLESHARVYLKKKKN